MKPGYYKHDGDKIEVVGISKGIAFGFDADGSPEYWTLNKNVMTPWQEPVCVEWWVNIYKECVGNSQPTKQDADDANIGKRIACHHFRFDGTKTVQVED